MAYISKVDRISDLKIHAFIVRKLEVTSELDCIIFSQIYDDLPKYLNAAVIVADRPDE